MKMHSTGVQAKYSNVPHIGQARQWKPTARIQIFGKRLINRGPCKSIPQPCTVLYVLPIVQIDKIKPDGMPIKSKHNRKNYETEQQLSPPIRHFVAFVFPLLFHCFHVHGSIMKYRATLKCDFRNTGRQAVRGGFGNIPYAGSPNRRLGAQRQTALPQQHALRPWDASPRRPRVAKQKSSLIGGAHFP